MVSLSRVGIAAITIGGLSLIAARKGLFGTTTVSLNIDDANPRVFDALLWTTVSWSPPSTSTAKAYTRRVRPIVFANTNKYGCPAKEARTKQ
jgi:hypothetical protein